MAISSRSSVPSRRATRAVTTLAVAATGVAGLAVAPSASAARPLATKTTKASPAQRTTAAAPRQAKPAASAVVTRFTSTGANVRSGASPNARRVATLTAGTRVQGTLSGGWLRLTAPKQYAGRYIKASLLTTAQPRPSQCLPSSARVTLTRGFVLCEGYTGVKVRLVRRALGLKTSPNSSKAPASQNGTLDDVAVNRLKRFQAEHNLPVTGEVDRATYALLVPGGDFDIDGWQNPSAVASTASRDQRVEAALAWARSKSGLPYVWGGTGTGGADDGYDCSGLVLQAVRAGGKNPVNVSNFTDIRPASDLASQMWKDTSEFAHVTKGFVTTIGAALKLARRGDLVFYATRSGSVGHVALYEGPGVKTIIDAVNQAVQVNRADNTFGYQRFGIARAFAR